MLTQQLFCYQSLTGPQQNAGPWNKGHAENNHEGVSGGDILWAGEAGVRGYEHQVKPNNLVRRLWLAHIWQKCG